MGVIQMAESKPDKKQITLSFKTKDPREIELYEFFSQAMGRQSLMKSILWDYYQKNKDNGISTPLNLVNNNMVNNTSAITNCSLEQQQEQTATNDTAKRRRNTPGRNALGLAM